MLSEPRITIWSWLWSLYILHIFLLKYIYWTGQCCLESFHTKANVSTIVYWWDYLKSPTSPSLMKFSPVFSCLDENLNLSQTNFVIQCPLGKLDRPESSMRETCKDVVNQTFLRNCKATAPGEFRHKLAPDSLPETLVTFSARLWHSHQSRLGLLGQQGRYQ